MGDVWDIPLHPESSPFSLRRHSMDPSHGGLRHLATSSQSSVRRPTERGGPGGPIWEQRPNLMADLLFFRGIWRYPRYPPVFERNRHHWRKIFIFGSLVLTSTGKVGLLLTNPRCWVVLWSRPRVTRVGRGEGLSMKLSSFLPMCPLVNQQGSWHHPFYIFLPLFLKLQAGSAGKEVEKVVDVWPWGRAVEPVVFCRLPSHFGSFETQQAWIAFKRSRNFLPAFAQKGRPWRGIAAPVRALGSGCCLCGSAAVCWHGWCPLHRTPPAWLGSRSRHTGAECTPECSAWL